MLDGSVREGRGKARPGLQIESLSVFLAAAEEGSIAKAAQKLYITPQGASSSIIALEKQLGVRLLSRTGPSVELTAEGRAVANEAERVIRAYRRLQTTAAIQGDDYRSDDALAAVVSPYVAQTLMPTIEEYGALTHGAPRVAATVMGVFDIAERYDSLPDDVLAIIDVPLDFSIVEDDLPAAFARRILEDEGFFRPFLLSTFMLRCADESAFARRKHVYWAELDVDRIACHNDAFLKRMIHHYTATPDERSLGVEVVDAELLEAMIQRHGMVGLFGSFPILFRERTLRSIYGAAVELRPKASFVTGVLARPGNAQAESYHRFMLKLLNQSYAGYMKGNDPEAFFKRNRPRASR